MKKALIVLILILIISEKSISQIATYRCEDTLFIKITCNKGGKQKDQQLMKIFCIDSVAIINFYYDYKVIITPKDGLSKERQEVAKVLVKTKKIKQLPKSYKEYLSIPINDSLSILKLVEIYSSEQTISKEKSTVYDCLEKINKWLMDKVKSDEGSNRKKRTKVEFKRQFDTNVYFLNGFYDSRKLFKCFFK